MPPRKIELLNGEKPVTSITVPAYGSAELKPGAMFVRLSELKGEPKAGDEVKVTLETDGGIAIRWPPSSSNRPIGNGNRQLICNPKSEIRNRASLA